MKMRRKHHIVTNRINAHEIFFHVCISIIGNCLDGALQFFADMFADAFSFNGSSKGGEILLYFICSYFINLSNPITFIFITIIIYIREEFSWSYMNSLLLTKFIYELLVPYIIAHTNGEPLEY